MKPPVCPPPGEDEAVAAVVSALHDQMVKDYPPPGLMRRDAHPKSHGTVQAEFIVDPAIPADLRHGVFAHAGRTYKAWIRFSNCFRIQPDLKHDTRGMAVKLLEVEKNPDPPLPSETGTQDFLSATGDAFFIPDAERYVGFPQAAMSGGLAILRFFVKKRLWRGIAAARRSTNALAMNPLAIEYFSQTPYHLGESETIKFHIRPLMTRALGESLPWAPGFRARASLANFLFTLGGVLRMGAAFERLCRLLADPNLLRNAMARALARHDAWFEFLVQRRVDGMSVEDATVSWDAAIAPFERVAWIRIPRQVFTTQEMESVGENISYNPWHTIAAHEPLGSINRARRHVNHASSKTRHAANHVPLDPPTVDEFDQIARTARLAPGAMDPRPEMDPATFRSKWAYLYLRRVPLLVALAMLAFPVAAAWPQSPLARYTRGIFDVEGPALFLVSLLSSLLAFTVMTTWWLITAYSSERCRARCTFAVYPIRIRWYVLSSLLILPILFATLAVVDRSAWLAGDWARTAGWWLGGAAAAAAVTWCVRWLADFLGGMVPVQNLARRACRFNVLSAGFVDASHLAFLPGHLFAAGLALVMLALYITIGAQTLGQANPQFPGLVFLILLPIIACWSLSFLTFFGDRFRAPILLPLAVLIALIHNLPGPRHVFHLDDATTVNATPSEVLRARPAGANAPADHVIVVAAGGGGTQGAVWTARVLTGLVERCRADGCDAASAIRMISAASGGSLGAMAFAAAYDNGQLPASLTPIRDRSAVSGQDALWRSLVFQDIYRPLRVVWPWPNYRDRALALEQAWQQGVGEAPVSAWRADARTGRRPGLVFNATVQGGSEQILISSAGRVPGAIDFLERYDERDLPVVRAARLSATFPVVVPFARDGLGLKPDKLLDGGYSDLFGLDAATSWLHDALTNQSPATVRRALVLEIRLPTPGESVLPSPPFAEQFERDQRGLRLLQHTWKDTIGVSSVALQLCAPPFTQWHITSRERAAIEEQWLRDASGAAVNAAIRFLKGEGEFADSRASITVNSNCP